MLHAALRGERHDERAVAEHAVPRAIEVDHVQPAAPERAIAREQLARLDARSASRREVALEAGARSGRRAGRWRESAASARSPRKLASRRAPARAERSGWNCAPQKFPLRTTAENWRAVVACAPASFATRARRSCARSRRSRSSAMPSSSGSSRSAIELVPAHVRHGRSGLRACRRRDRVRRCTPRQSRRPPSSERVEQQLHAEADAEHRLRQLRQRPRRGRLRCRRCMASRGGADAGQDDTRGARGSRSASVVTSRARAEPLQRELQRGEVGAAAVDDRRHRCHAPTAPLGRRQVARLRGGTPGAARGRRP